MASVSVEDVQAALEALASAEAEEEIEAVIQQYEPLISKLMTLYWPKVKRLAGKTIGIVVSDLSIASADNRMETINYLVGKYGVTPEFAMEVVTRSTTPLTINTPKVG